MIVARHKRPRDQAWRLGAGRLARPGFGLLVSVGAASTAGKSPSSSVCGSYRLPARIWGGRCKIPHDACGHAVGSVDIGVRHGGVILH